MHMARDKQVASLRYRELHYVTGSFITVQGASLHYRELHYVTGSFIVLNTLALRELALVVATHA